MIQYCSSHKFSWSVLILNITCIVWAPGEGPLILQENLGGPLFGSTGFSAFSIEIHYNNPGTYAANALANLLLALDD